MMKIIHDLLGAPEFNCFTMEYAYSDGTRIAAFEYVRLWWKKYHELEDQRRRAESEDRLKAIQATAVMNEMISGTAPSVIHRRLRAQNIL